MKKTLLSAAALCLGLQLSAQTVLFSEDFQSGTMPGTWIITNSDGLTPATNVAWCTNAWVVRDDFADATNKVAASTSWYVPAGISNDWMATPQVSITQTGTILKWRSMAQDPLYPDGYRVYVTTASGGAPADFTGGSGTQVYTTTADNTVWTDHTINLDAFVGQTIRIGFRNNSNDMFVLMVDDVQVLHLDPNDAEVSSITTTPYVVGPSNVNITGQITNTGSSAITGFDLKWSDGTTTHTQTLTGLNIPSLGTYNYTHTTQLAVVGGTNYNIKVWTELAGDANQTNDTAMATIYGLTFMPTKRVVGEEATGTWCGWCPRGHVYMAQMEANFPSTWIGVAVHNSDPMTVAAYDAAVGLLIGGYPSGLVDREILDTDPSAFPAGYATQIAKTAPANVSVTNGWNSGTRQLSVTVDATFAASFTAGNFRLAAIVVENNVTGSTAAYNQTNYYSFQTNNLALNGAGHNWQTEPDPVLAANMVYDDVARAMLPAFAGQAGSVPAAITAGNTYSATFNYTVPASQDETELVVIGILIDNTTGIIVNAAEADAVLGLSEIAEDNFSVGLFPNPTTDMTTIKLNIIEAGDVAIEIVSLTGAVVSSKSYGSLSGLNTFMLDASNYNAGIYFVNVKVGDAVITKKLVVTK